MQLIDQAIEKIRYMERQNLLSYKPTPTANKAVLPFVLTYHPDLSKTRGIVDKYWPIIESSEHSLPREANHKSLRDLLLQGRLNQIQSMMSLLANAKTVADQDVKPAK